MMMYLIHFQGLILIINSKQKHYRLLILAKLEVEQ